MKKISIPIGVKLISITSLILLTSLLGTNYTAGIFFERDTVTRIQEVTADKSHLLSLKVYADITYMIDRARMIAISLIDDLENTNSDKTSSEQYRIEEVENSTQLFYVGLYRRQGDTLVIVQDQINPSNVDQVTDPNLYRDLSKNMDFLSEIPVAPFVYNVTSMAPTPTLALIFPIKNKNLSNDYFALAYISENIFADAINIVSEYQTYVVNHQGDLLSHKNADLLKSGVSFRSDGIVQAMLKSPINNGQLSYKDREGIQHIGSFYKIELGSLGVVSTAERDRILQAVYQIRRRNYIITGIVLLLSVMIVYLFAKTLSNPVRRLVAAAREVEKGHFLLNIKASSRDEIGELTRSFTQMGKGLNERDRMKDALGKFVNEEVANLALKGELSLGGERKEAAVFFSDIRSFTAISEKLTPEEVVEFLNEYMTAMVACVEATHGVVDKFIGDAVMAIWGAPISHGNDTENSINSALMMRAALKKFNEGRGGDKKPIIKIGCGINTGPLVSGQIGSEKRMEYTVIGDAVNLASRIEGLTKPFGTDILISEGSYEMVQGMYYTAEMPPIMVKGKSHPINIYAVVGRRDDPEAFTSIDQLRKYLGTENVDLSDFDGVGKEEKFAAVTQKANKDQDNSEYNVEEDVKSRVKEQADITSPVQQNTEALMPEFMETARLVQPQAVSNENRQVITSELLALRESIVKHQLSIVQAAQKLRELRQNSAWSAQTKTLHEAEQAKVKYFQELVHLKTALELGKISPEDAERKLRQLKHQYGYDKPEIEFEKQLQL